MNGEDLGPVDVTYSSGSAPVDFGTYTATATYVDVNDNDYLPPQELLQIVIRHANATAVGNLSMSRTTVSMAPHRRGVR